MSRPRWNKDWVEDTACVGSPPSTKDADFFISFRLGVAGIFGDWTGAYPPHFFPRAEQVANDALDLYLALHSLPTGTYIVRKGYYGHGYKGLTVVDPLDGYGWKKST